MYTETKEIKEICKKLDTNNKKYLVAVANALKFAAENKKASKTNQKPA